jgi:hypothetical protein
LMLDDLPQIIVSAARVRCLLVAALAAAGTAVAAAGKPDPACCLCMLLLFWLLPVQACVCCCPGCCCCLLAARPRLLLPRHGASTGRCCCCCGRLINASSSHLRAGPSEGCTPGKPHAPQPPPHSCRTQHTRGPGPIHGGKHAAAAAGARAAGGSAGGEAMRLEVGRCCCCWGPAHLGAGHAGARDGIALLHGWPADGCQILGSLEDPQFGCRCDSMVSGCLLGPRRWLLTGYTYPSVECSPRCASSAPARRV